MDLFRKPSIDICRNYSGDFLKKSFRDFFSEILPETPLEISLRNVSGFFFQGFLQKAHSFLWKFLSKFLKKYPGNIFQNSWIPSEIAPRILLENSQGILFAFAQQKFASEFPLGSLPEMSTIIFLEKLLWVSSEISAQILSEIHTITISGNHPRLP